MAGGRTLKNYAMKVLHMDGKPIDWKNPPDGNTQVMWSKKTTGMLPIHGSFRTICHLDHLNRLAYLKYGVGIEVIQRDWNTGVPASAGTHDFDSVFDVWIPGVDPWEQQRFLRRHGFGCWVRKPPLFGWHIHGFTLPPREGHSIGDDFKVHGFKVGLYVDGGWSSRGALVSSSQIDDYYNHAFGLSGMHDHGSDHSWFPKDIEATIFVLSNFVHRRAQAA